LLLSRWHITITHLHVNTHCFRIGVEKGMKFFTAMQEGCGKKDTLRASLLCSVGKIFHCVHYLSAGLRRRQWTMCFHKKPGVSSLLEEWVPSQEAHCSMDFVSGLVISCLGLTTVCSMCKEQHVRAIAICVSYVKDELLFCNRMFLEYCCLLRCDAVPCPPILTFCRIVLHPFYDSPLYREDKDHEMRSSDVSIHFYQSSRRHNLEDSNHHIHHREDFRFPLKVLNKLNISSLSQRSK
jgi:hypothetical protein